MIRPIAKFFGVLMIVLVIAGVLSAIAGWYVTREIGRALRGPDPVSIATASMESMREQSRLTPFAARYVAVVTSTQSRFGLSARKTLIMPGNVRYEVDLGKLGQRDLAWDAGSHTLSVTLPDVELAGPDIDFSGMREYDGGGMLMALTDAGKRIDAANRAAAQRELMVQARAPLPMKLARDAARRAVERSFAMPLRAAGLDAQVKVVFADERAMEQMDRSRSIQEVYANGAG